MSPVLDTMPRRTQAALLRRVAGAAHPKIEIPTIASNFSLTVAELKTLMDRAGWPDRRAMIQRAELLEELAEYYDARTVDLCTAGQRQQRSVEAGALPPDSLGATQARVGPEAYAAAKRCQELARDLVDAHAALVAATRAWRRLG